MAPAKLRLHYKNSTADGILIEMVIWELPEGTRERPHAIKYRLYAGRLDGTLIVRYDNELGKGNHRHDPSGETPYSFKDVDRLIADFLNDIETARKHGR